MNLNKLFPRLKIRAKLGIAFAVLAVLPLAVTAFLTVRQTVGYLRSLANETLAHDVSIAHARVGRAIERTQRDIDYLTSDILGPALVERAARPDGTVRDGLDADVSRFLMHAPTLIRVRLISDQGRVLLSQPVAYGEHAVDANATGGLLYALRAESLGEGERLLMPVELRGDTDDDSEADPLPAIALLMAVRGPDGRFLGAVVGEAYAMALFAGIEEGSPNMPSTTGLVDPEGRLLFHSERKSDWTSLLGERLIDEFSARDAEIILAGGRRTFETEDERIASVTAVGLGDAGFGQLVLYRVMPVAVLYSPVRTFNNWVLVTGAVIVLVVLLLAFVAARQLTKPIYRLKSGFARLARGEEPVRLDVETNDELEDLASEFFDMASALHGHRRRLEELVEERTRAFRQTHAELSDILAYSADAIIGLDEEDRVRVWNRGAEQLFGFEETEVMNRPLDSVLIPDELRESPEAEYLRAEIAARGSVVGLRTRRLNRDGELIPVSLTQTQIADADGRPHGTSMILRDARMQERMEEQLRRSERLAAVSVMAAGLAHEVNNPLAIVLNRIECMEEELRDGADASVLAADVEVLREHTLRLQSVTRDLLRFAREYDEDPHPVDLAEVCSRVCRLLDRTLAARGMSLEVSADSVLPTVTGSEPALETVIMNLMLNAADAMPEGGSINIRTRLASGEHAVEMIVEDSGAGIPAGLREKVFEPFFTTKDKQNGLGLGLALCRSIVERHEGRIWVEEGEDAGCRFVVSIPRDLGEAA